MGDGGIAEADYHVPGDGGWVGLWLSFWPYWLYTQGQEQTEREQENGSILGPESPCCCFSLTWMISCHCDLTSMGQRHRCSDALEGTYPGG